jgi:glucose-6-phosphate isomerase
MPASRDLEMEMEQKSEVFLTVTGPRKVRGRCSVMDSVAFAVMYIGGRAVEAAC